MLFLCHTRTLLTPLSIIALAIALSVSQAQAADAKGSFSVSIENDVFSTGGDNNYTHGTEFTYVSDTYMPRWLTRIAAELNLDPPEVELRSVTNLGQKIFTPEDIENVELIPDDRPYAGWLYLSSGLIADSYRGSVRRLAKLQFILGWVGPSSLADTVQTNFHRALGFRDPNGWQHQLHDEPTFDIQYQNQWMIPLLDDHIDIIPQVNTILGSSTRFLGTGFTFRIGNRITSDYGPPLIRPSASGSHYFKPHGSTYWYLFAGAFGRYMEHNLFLDGNGDGDSHSVDRIPWVGDLQMGLVFGWKNWRITLTNVIRTKEFEEQDNSDAFGAFGITVRI